MLILLGVMIYSFRSEIAVIVGQLKSKYFPCKDPINYSLGVFDERFGISQEDFLTSLESAESIWEESISENLFEYKDGGKLKINLIYDNRQLVTDKLEQIDSVVEEGKGSYNEIKIQYEALKKEYESEKISFESRLRIFEERRDAYEVEVKYWNAKGGASKAQYDKLQAEQKYLQAEAATIANLQSVLNKKIENLNTMASILNGLANSLNLNVNKFNTIATENGGEFEEGTYERDANGERINIYQFDNQAKLIRVMIHEFGHALGLEHVEDSKAIMYRLNNGINQELTASDINAIKTRCGIVQ